MNNFEFFRCVLFGDTYTVYVTCVNYSLCHYLMIIDVRKCSSESGGSVTLCAQRCRWVMAFNCRPALGLQ